MMEQFLMPGVLLLLGLVAISRLKKPTATTKVRRFNRRLMKMEKSLEVVTQLAAEVKLMKTRLIAAEQDRALAVAQATEQKFKKLKETAKPAELVAINADARRWAIDRLMEGGMSNTVAEELVEWAVAERRKTA